MAALLYPTFKVSRNGAILIRFAAGAGLAASYFAGIDGHEVFGFTWVSLCSAGLLVNAFTAGAAAARYSPGRIVCWLGRHSYELYLFHIILLALIRDRIPKASLAPAYKLPLFIVFLALSALLAGVVARYFADPVNARLRTFLKGNV